MPVASTTQALNDLEMADSDELDKARNGLWKAQRVHVRPGQWLYRFTAFSKPHLWYSGAWWFEFEHYKRIATFAEASGMTLGYTARRLAGLAYEWRDCTVDGLERAFVAGRLDAWAGPGRYIRGTERAKGRKTRHYHLLPPQDIMQLYIPGLRSGHGSQATRSAISVGALSQCSCTQIPSGYFA
jgi:hypothetical protein